MCFSIIGGTTPKKLGADFVTEGVPVASANLVSGGRLDLASARRVHTETWKSADARAPRKAGDVLLTSVALLGRVARADFRRATCSCGSAYMGYVGSMASSDNGYLYYALQTERVAS